MNKSRRRDHDKLT